MTIEEIKQVLSQAVQDMMDREAGTKNYDSILSVCTYIDTGVERFDVEGRKARQWRSACWDKCYKIYDEVEAGERPIPSVEELLAEMPKIEW